MKLILVAIFSLLAWTDGNICGYQDINKMYQAQQTWSLRSELNRPKKFKWHTVNSKRFKSGQMKLSATTVARKLIFNEQINQYASSWNPLTDGGYYTVIIELFPVTTDIFDPSDAVFSSSSDSNLMTNSIGNVIAYTTDADLSNGFEFDFSIYSPTEDIPRSFGFVKSINIMRMVYNNIQCIFSDSMGPDLLQQAPGNYDANYSGMKPFESGSLSYNTANILDFDCWMNIYGR